MVGTSADDADATVDFGKINSAIDTTDLEGVGTERAGVVDPIVCKTATKGGTSIQVAWFTPVV
jgi:hypothetical protein